MTYGAEIDLRTVMLGDAATAEGAVVVVDVIRAFTTAAFAFAAGVRSILLVAEPEEAFALKRRYPDALLIGESGGRKISGFDLGNSPEPFVSGRFDGIMCIQRTSHGTQGVVRARRAKVVYPASLVIAAATAELVRKSGEREATFVITGCAGVQDGDEDLACADYIRDLLEQRPIDPSAVIDRVRHASWAARFVDESPGDFPRQDLKRCVDIDRFPFGLQVVRQEDLLVMTSILP